MQTLTRALTPTGRSTERPFFPIACAFAYVSSFGVSDVEFANQLLNKHAVATLAGSSFGKRGDGYLRLSFGTQFEKLAVALDRIARFSEGLRHVRT